MYFVEQNRLYMWHRVNNTLFKWLYSCLCVREFACFDDYTAKIPKRVLHISRAATTHMTRAGQSEAGAVPRIGRSVTIGAWHSPERGYLTISTASSLFNIFPLQPESAWRYRRIYSVTNGTRLIPNTLMWSDIRWLLICWCVSEKDNKRDDGCRGLPHPCPKPPPRRWAPMSVMSSSAKRNVQKPLTR